MQRSRFITTVSRAGSADEARALVSRQREEFSDASHTCWAYLVGPPGSTTTIGLSDDGEPHGTAGRPIFAVLSHARVGDVVAAVTRYFGGTRLGKGGLVRAYSQGVVEALSAMATVEKVRRVRVAIEVEYAHTARVRRLLAGFDAHVRDEIREALTAYNHRELAVAASVEGGGLLAAAARTTISALMLVAGPRYPMKLFGARETAAAWLAQRVGARCAPPVSADDVLALAAQARAALR